MSLFSSSSDSPAPEHAQEQDMPKNDESIAETFESQAPVLPKDDAPQQEPDTVLTVIPKSSAAEPLPVDINILGKTYRITCPSDARQDLDDACSHINEFVTDIQATAAHLSYEHLLVLCCLNLYEQMKNNDSRVLPESDVEQAHSILDTLLNDMQTQLAD